MIRTSIAAVAILVLVGCGGTGSTSKKSETKAATIADAKKMAENIGIGVGIGNGISKIGESSRKAVTPKSRSIKEESCPNGGSIKMDFDENQFMVGQIPTTIEMGIEMINCVADGEITNGKMKFVMTNFTEDAIDATISFPTDFTFTADGETGKINAGGSIQIKEQAPYEVMTINITAVHGAETYDGKNLVYKMKTNDDGSVEEFPVSGEENFGSGVYFKVDPGYDASQTPMVTDFSGNLRSGLFKYLDGANHKVEAEVTATNEVTVRVDENGNGTFEPNETETINLK